MATRNSPAHALTYALQFGDSSLKSLATRARLNRWISAALFAPAEFTIRFVDSEEGRMLNSDFRGKNYATNVLTFAYGEDPLSGCTLADIVLCSEVVASEALAQGKTIEAHLAHLVVHGVLHAQGYDHEDDADAAEMESLEIVILDELGFANPYEAA